MKTKTGFTLVELSIVLVIIGLLIGGILVAQSMIATTKIGKVVSDLSQYDIAVSNFKTSYRSLPGDSPLFPCADGTGNNNGQIELQTNDSVSEAASAWSHLSLGVGLKNAQRQNYAPYDFFAASANQDAPVLPFPSVNNSENPPKLNFYGKMPSGDRGESWTFVSVEVGGIGSSTVNDSVKPSDLLALDSKIDNGLSDTGKIVGDSYTHSNDNSEPDCKAGSGYNTASDTFSCTPVIQIGASGAVVNQ